MKSLLLVLLLTVIISPWAAFLADSFLESRPSFSHIFGRLFMILGAALFFICRPLLKIESLSQLGLKPARQWHCDFARGALTAVASVIIVGALMSVLDVFTPFFRLSLSVALERSAKALLTALAVGVLEEIFFRGVIFKGLLEDLKPAAAFALSSLFYSAIHFIKPAEEFSLTRIDPWAGARYLVGAFGPFLDPLPLLPGLLGLFLIGMVLSYAFFRTGSLYLSMGLHAGWVFGLKTIRVYGDFRREDLGWLFGSLEPKLVSGVAVWTVILAVGLVIHWLTRNRLAPTEGRLAAKEGRRPTLN
ncbi:MAG: CPBP family intramembrane metalloprotease [Deltaproteobacteria bacterium]|nr:CPBP family intramembrane metalloprotease [Deltaproteobacteria bacterium]